MKKNHIQTAALTMGVLLLILAEAIRAADFENKEVVITTPDGKKQKMRFTGGFIPEAMAELDRQTTDRLNKIKAEAICARDKINVWECEATKLDVSKLSDESLAKWIQEEERNLANIKKTIRDKEKRVAVLKKHADFKNLKTLDHAMLERESVTVGIIEQRIAVLNAIKKTHTNPEDRLDLYNAMFRGEISCGFFLMSNPDIEYSMALFSNNPAKTAGAKKTIYEQTEKCQQLLKNLPKQEKSRARMR